MLSFVSIPESITFDIFQLHHNTVYAILRKIFSRNSNTPRKLVFSFFGKWQYFQCVTHDADIPFNFCSSKGIYSSFRRMPKLTETFTRFNTKLNLLTAGNSFDVWHQPATSGKTWSDHDVTEKISTVLKKWRVGLRRSVRGALFDGWRLKISLLMVDGYILGPLTVNG